MKFHTPKFVARIKIDVTKKRRSLCDGNTLSGEAQREREREREREKEKEKEKEKERESLVDVLRHPAESLAISLSFENGAHEDFRRTSAVQLAAGDRVLSCAFSVQSEVHSDFVF